MSLILISAGFDAYFDDPLAGMRVSAPQFERLTSAICAVADRVCDGKVVAVSEGGYNLAGLNECIQAAISGLDGSAGVGHPAPNGPTARGDACLAAVKPQIAKYWTV